MANPVDRWHYGILKDDTLEGDVDHQHLAREGHSVRAGGAAFGRESLRPVRVELHPYAMVSAGQAVGPPLEYIDRHSVGPPLE